MRWWPSFRTPRTPVRLVLYTREGCGLCEDMKAVIAATRLPRPYELVEVDIARDPELLAAYGRSIPVLEIAGRVAFKGRMEPDAFHRKFLRLAGGGEGRA